jgi:phosphatidylinositol glycan class B
MNFLSNYKYWLFTAVILHILVAWFSVGHYHDDEYAQILSFAAARMGVDMQSQLMWEFEAGVRSGFQPYVAYLLSTVSESVGISSPFSIAFFYRLLSASISLVATIVFIKIIIKDIGSGSVLNWTVFFLLFSWILLFINVRFSSEGWSTSFFILGYGLFLSTNPPNAQRYLAVGFFLGLAFLARYQVGFMLFGLGLWMVFIHRINHINLTYILIAGLLTIMLGGAFDWWLYGEPTVSSWNYFKWHYDGLTSLSGGISSTGEPWWFYIQYSSLQLLPPITLFLPIVVVAICFFSYVFWA